MEQMEWALMNNLIIDEAVESKNFSIILIAIQQPYGFGIPQEFPYHLLL